MNVNVRAPLLLLQSLLPHVSSRGGRVINMFGLSFTLFLNVKILTIWQLVNSRTLTSR